METIAHRTSAEPTSSLRLLQRAQLANAVGDGAFFVTSVVAFTRLLGVSPLQIGSALTIAWGLGFLCSTPIGRLADRAGLRRAAIALALTTSVAIASLLLARSIIAFVVLLSVYAVAQSGSAAVRQALLIEQVSAAERTGARARLQATVNAGIGAGAALGGLALHAGSSQALGAVLILDATSFLLAARLLSRLPAVARTTASTPVASPTSTTSVLRDRPYVAAAALNAVLYLYLPMLSVVLPLYIVERTAAPVWSIAGLFVLNTAGVLTLQVRAARAVHDLRSASRSVRRGGFAFLAACLAFALAAAPQAPYVALSALVAGAVLQVVGEIMIASGSWEISFGLADPARPAEWQGLYGASLPIARAMGPLVLTFLLLDWSGPGWLVLGLAFLLAATAMTPVVRRGQRVLSSTTSPCPACPELATPLG